MITRARKPADGPASDVVVSAAAAFAAAWRITGGSSVSG